ncbi:hypothetical protein Dimus_024975 [Dionaea muscipula]
MDGSNGRGEGINESLIGRDRESADHHEHHQPRAPNEVAAGSLGRRVWVETKKLWHLAGPSVITRLSTFATNVIMLIFAGHMGDLQLAAVSIAINVIIGFTFGLLLGMSSALETLCGQAFGAKRYNMLGVYLQRSWIILTLCCIILLPFYIWSGPILKAVGLSESLAAETEVVTLWLIPMLLSFALQFPLLRFLQSQLKTQIIAWVSLVALIVDIFLSWLLVYVIPLGVTGLAIAIDASWLCLAFGMLGYAVGGWCPDSWTGFSWEAFDGLWEFVKLSVGSGVMLCLEYWYYKILVFMTGDLKNATIVVDALSICIMINGFEQMIPIGFLAATAVRVANELGAGNGKGAKFATIVSTGQSIVIGLIIFALILIFHDKYGLIFSSSAAVLEKVDKLSILLAFSILLNSIQPILSGVAVGSGWQSWVAYINLGCYYVIGLPLGILMGWVFHTGVEGIWGGMLVGGTLLQTLILFIITARSDWDKEAEKAQNRVKKWSQQV